MKHTRPTKMKLTFETEDELAVLLAMLARLQVNDAEATWIAVKIYNDIKNVVGEEACKELIERVAYTGGKFL